MIQKKLLYLISICILMTGLTIPPGASWPWEDETITRRWYMRYPDTHNVTGILGYVLNTSQTSTWGYVWEQKSGDYTVYVATRVFLTQTGSQTELTSGYGVNVSRAASGSGIQSVNWLPPETDVTVGSQAIRVNIYLKIGTDSWVHKATFISSLINYAVIKNDTWTFDLYTERAYIAPGTTQIYFYWGNSTRYSRIRNIDFQRASPWEEMNNHLANGRWFDFLVTPWTYYLSNSFYGIIVLYLVITLYNKYGSVRPLVPWLWLFAGTGGLLTMLIPAMGLYLAWFLVAVSLASTLILLFR